MGQLRHLARRSLWMGLLFMAALSMRMLVPGGWMAAADAAGFELRPCSGWSQADQRPASASHHASHSGHASHGDHMVLADHPADRQEKPHGHGTRADQPCAFAGLAMAFLAAAGPKSLAAPSAHAHLPAPTPADEPAWRLAAPPPPQTGPPSST